MHTEAINHDPAVTFFQTGFQLAGRPSIGAWISYGLGSENQDLPAFVVMVSQGSGDAQALADRAVGQRLSADEVSGREVPLRRRSGALSVESRRAIRATARRRLLDDLAKLNELKLQEYQDPEIATRIAQYEMAFRMQTLGAGADRSLEGTRSPRSSSMARMRASRAPTPPTAFWRGGWPSAACASSSSSIAAGISTAICRRRFAAQCLQTDQPSAALIQDLKQRGLLDDTLVVWGGEFGRTVYSQGTLTEDELRPRSSSALLHASGWRAAASRAA